MQELSVVAPEGISMERSEEAGPAISEAAAEVVAEHTHVDPFAAPLDRMRKEDASLIEIAEAFVALDKDGNKKITRDEFKKGISKLKLYSEPPVASWTTARSSVGERILPAVLVKEPPRRLLEMLLVKWATLLPSQTLVRDVRPHQSPLAYLQVLLTHVLFLMMVQ